MGNFNYTKFGLIFWIVGSILALIATIPLLFFIQDLLNMTDVSTLTDFSGLIAILILAIVGFIGVVFYLVAYILMCVGGIGYREFGEKHRKFLFISLIILITIIVLNIVSAVYQMMTVGNAASTGDLSGIVNIYILPIAATIVGGLFYVFLLHELEDFKGRIVLYVMLGCTIAIAIVIAFLQYSNFDAWAANVDKLIANLPPSSTIMGISSSQSPETVINQAVATEGYKYTIYSIIPMFLQFAAMILAFFRIRSGALKPVPRSVTSGRKCTNCGFDVPQYSETCPKCGQFYGAPATQALPAVSLKFCPNCGHKNEEGKTFCEECGVKF